MRVRPGVLAVLAVLAVPALALSACDPQGGRPDGPDPTPSTTGTASGPACLEAEAGGTALQVTVPAGFVDATEDSLLDQRWARPPTDGGDSPDVVSLDAFDRDSPDTYVVQRTMAASPSPTTSGTAYESAVDRVADEGLTEVSWVTPDRTGTGSHTADVRLIEADGERFTLGITADTDVVDELRTEVVDSLAPGPCP